MCSSSDELSLVIAATMAENPKSRTKQSSRRRTTRTVVEEADDEKTKAPKARQSPRKRQNDHDDEKDSSPLKKKTSTPEKEIRLARYRSSCPRELKDRMDRALQQRMYLVHSSKETILSPESSSSPANSNNNKNNKETVQQLNYYWKFDMLGSTGNVYTTCLTHQPTCTCPDFQKRRDLCKHLIFVFVRVVGLSTNDSLAYQKALVTSELETLYQRVSQRVQDNNSNDSSSDVWANPRVRSRYAAMKQGKGKAGDHGNNSCEEQKQQQEQDDGAVQRRSLEQDCPICLEDMSTCPLAQVTYCKISCGMNFHLECMNMWRRAAGNRQGTSTRGAAAVTCPNCRAVEPAPTPKRRTAGGRGQEEEEAKEEAKEEGYINMGRFQGQSPIRDTSTYYSGRFRRSYD